jgi:type IV secretory pathway VirB6-like protein
MLFSKPDGPSTYWFAHSLRIDKEARLANPSIAIHYIGIQYIAIHYIGIGYIAIHYVGIQYMATHYIALH